MALSETDYLLRRSGLAVSFVGFSAVVVALRRALGAELSDPHMYFVRFLIEGSLLVAAFALLPAALSFTGLENSTTWRLSSAAAALVFSIYLPFLFRRRRRVTTGPIPVLTRVFFGFSLLATVALWVNAVGFGPSAAVYALTLTWLLVLGGWVFVQNLDLFFGKTSSR